MKRLVAVGFVLLTIAATAAADITQQNVAKGFSVDKTYSVDDFDFISTFNGNLGVRLPIGPRYQASSALSYQFSLLYGGNVWKFDTANATRDNPTTGGKDEIYVDFANLGAITQAGVMANANAGVGWTVTLGYFDYGSDHSDYVSSDGASHRFSPVLNAGDTVVSGVAYTRDGSYLRMTYLNDTTTQIEFPDGTRHQFERGGPTGRLKAMLDRFGNSVTITYAPGPTCSTDPSECAEDWTITDGVRTHIVDMKRLVRAGSSTGLYETYSFDIVKTITFLAGNAAQSVYTFSYTNSDSLTGISRKLAPRQDCRVPAVMLAAILEKVTLPDGTSYDITVDRGDAAWSAIEGKWTGKFSSPTGTGSGVNQNCGPGVVVEVSPTPSFSGHLVKLKRPTGAVTEWSYKDYAFPPHVPAGVNGCRDGDLTTCSFGLSNRHALGVHERLDRSAGNALLSKRRYEHGYVGSAFLGTYTTVSTFEELAGTAPVSKSTHYYNTRFQRNDPKRVEYGLPYSDVVADLPPTEPANPDSGGRYLASKQYDGAGNLLKYTFVKYVAEPNSIDPENEASVNRRVVSERTVHLDASGAISNEVIADQEDFDGLGHYRTMTTKTGPSSTSAAITRKVKTNYNAPDTDVDSSARNTGTYPGSTYVPFPTDAPWILNTYSSQTVTEGSQSTKTLALFDANTGYLKRRRTLKTVASTTSVPVHANDLLAVFEQTGGNTTSESYYGGDTQSMGTAALVSLTPPTTPVHRVVHTYVSGTLASSKQDGVSFKSVDRTIDAHTGLVSKSTDSAGVSTEFEYDTLGRMTWSVPTGGAATQYTYGTNTVAIVQKNGGKTATTLVSAKVHYDDLGRVVREERRMPSGSLSARQTKYNGRGLVASITEWVADSALTDTSPRTTYTYDALGRVLTATAPDASATSYTYIAGRSVERTTNVATSATAESAVKVTEKTDDFGRLVQVIEPGTTTTYGYDVGGRLSSVSMTDGATTQPRGFSYDGRGFLTSETHPESGTTTYQYDARGNVTLRTAADSTPVAFQYDAAGRVTHVASGTQTLKSFTYDRANSSDELDKSMGKMATASRHNPNAPGGNVIVTETYSYRNAAGRLSAKTTALSTGESFTDAYTYNRLGATLSITYPACSGCGLLVPPDRTISNSYSNGLLTGVSGYAALDYDPNGMLTTVTHTKIGGGSVVDTYTVDEDTKMARPKSVQFSGFCTDLSVAPLTSTAVTSGSSANLTASANGASTYQWYERAADGSSTPISGQNTSTLTVTVTSTKQFWVRVGNGTCTVDSNVATVTANACAAPSSTITAPATVRRNVSATASVPLAPSGATYEWTISGGDITSGAATNSITFIATCGASSVTLTAKVRASCGTDSLVSTKTISTSPAVTATLSTTTPTIAQGSTATIHVDLTGTAGWTLNWSPSAPACGTVGASFDCTVTPGATTTYTLTATDANGCAATSAPLKITVTPPAPQGLAATATSATQVQLTWTYSGTAPDSYEIQRRAAGGSFIADGASVTTTSAVRAATASSAYLYRVRAVKAGTPSAWSTVDLATTVIFVDDPLQQFSTRIAAQHITQLRTAVNAVRALWDNALPAATFTDASLSGASPNKAHIQELRDVLNQARTGLGLATWAFTDPILATGNPMKTVHVTDIRGGVR